MGGIFGIIPSILFEQKNKPIIVSGLVLLAISSVFGLIIFLNTFTEEPGDFVPSPKPANFADLLKLNPQQRQQPQVQGESTQNPEFGPDKPSPTPSATPTSSATPTPTPSATPTSTPTSTPTVTPTSTPGSNQSTTAPGTPGNLQVRQDGCNGSTPKIEVKWDGVSGATSYKIIRNGSEITEQPGTWYMDQSGISSGTNYEYKVKAKNSGGDSGESGPASINPSSCPSPTP